MSDMKIGSQDVKAVYLGTNKVDMIYLGENIVHAGYCYPCLSATDKHQLRLEDIPFMELDAGSSGNMYLSKYTENAEITITINGNIFRTFQLPLNKQVSPGVYGFCTLLGDRIRLSGMCNMRLISQSAAGSTYKFQWKIDGRTYIYNIET